MTRTAHVGKLSKEISTTVTDEFAELIADRARASNCKPSDLMREGLFLLLTGCRPQQKRHIKEGEVMRTQPDLFSAKPVPRFDTDALGFLIKFARRKRGQSFSAEQVTLAALDRGIAPADLRSWGAVFSQAARDGYIRRSEVLFQRSMGNGSLAPGWTGV